MPKILLLSFTFLLTIPLFSQTPKSQIGIQAGNNLSFPSGSSSTFRKDEFYLRYSIGIIGRIRLEDHWKWHFIAPLKKGIVTLDYGINMVLKGYSYQFGDLNSSTNQVSFELPFLINLYDERNVFIPRKWRRKGITTFARIGFKPSLSPKKKIRKELKRSDEKIVETVNGEIFNLLYSMSGGIIQNKKDGTSVLVEFSANLGLIKRTKGHFSYENQVLQIFDTESFFNTGSYISLNLTYLFSWEIFNFLKKEIPPPIIYNPRF